MGMKWLSGNLFLITYRWELPGAYQLHLNKTGPFQQGKLRKMRLFGLFVLGSTSAISFQRLLENSGLPNATMIDLFEDLQVSFGCFTLETCFFRLLLRQLKIWRKIWTTWTIFGMTLSTKRSKSKPETLPLCPLYFRLATKKFFNKVTSLEMQ